ncbi:MAG: PepSY-like domain-containing protein [Pirellulales bacterium]
MRLRIFSAVIVLAVAGIGPLSAAGKEEKVSLEAVPAAVAKAEKAKWPKAQILGIEREEEDGNTIFEFGLKEGTRKWDASFNPTGGLVAVEETIAETDVPGTVKKVVAKKYAQAKVVLIEKVTEGEGESAKVFYEYKLKTGDDGLEVKLDPAGKVLGEEQKKGEDLNE